MATKNTKQKSSSIRIDKSVVKKLEALKKHPRQSHQEVIIMLIESYSK